MKPTFSNMNHILKKACIPVLLILSPVFYCKAEVFVIEGIAYNSISDNEVEIIDRDEISPNLIIKEKIDYNDHTYTVIGIRADAFKKCNTLETIELPNSITYIGQSAFEECSNLRSVKLSDSISAIQGKVFSNCTSLKTIHLPEKIEYIGVFAFSDCTSLSSINIPESVVNIMSYAFVRCTSLETINIPSSVVSIDNSAFQECSSLKSITVDPENANYVSVSGVLFSKDLHTLYYYPEGLTGEYVVPEGVSVISSDAFGYCKGITGIELPESLKQIEAFALSHSYKIMTVIVRAQMPPVSTSYAWDLIALDRAILYVPTESLDLYRKNQGWKCFRHIDTLDSLAAIEEIEKEDPEAPQNVFDLSGRVVLRNATREEIDNLPSGIYIVGKQKKIIP